MRYSDGNLIRKHKLIKTNFHTSKPGIEPGTSYTVVRHAVFYK